MSGMAILDELFDYKTVGNYKITFNGAMSVTISRLITIQNLIPDTCYSTIEMLIGQHVYGYQFLHICNFTEIEKRQVLLPSGYRNFGFQIFNLKFHCGKSVQIRSFFWSVFSCIWTEYENLRSKSPYLVQIQENRHQKNLRFRKLFTLFWQPIITL